MIDPITLSIIVSVFVIALVRLWIDILNLTDKVHMQEHQIESQGYILDRLQDMVTELRINVKELKQEE